MIIQDADLDVVLTELIEEEERLRSGALQPVDTALLEQRRWSADHRRSLVEGALDLCAGMLRGRRARQHPGGGDPNVDHELNAMVTRIGALIDEEIRLRTVDQTPLVDARHRELQSILNPMLMLLHERSARTEPGDQPGGSGDARSGHATRRSRVTRS